MFISNNIAKSHNKLYIKQVGFIKGHIYLTIFFIHSHSSLPNYLYWLVLMHFHNENNIHCIGVLDLGGTWTSFGTSSTDNGNFPVSLPDKALLYLWLIMAVKGIIDVSMHSVLLLNDYMCLTLSTIVSWNLPLRNFSFFFLNLEYIFTKNFTYF